METKKMAKESVETYDSPKRSESGGVPKHKVYNVFSMILIALGLTLGTIGMTLFGDTSSKAATVAGQDEVFKYNIVNDTYIEITGLVEGTDYAGQDGEGNLIIPAEIAGLPVTGIYNGVYAAGAFNYCSNIKTVAFENPDSITTIGDFAFSGCAGLTSMVIPNSVISIGISAFRDCSELGELTIPSGVTTINNNTFLGCSKLTNIVMSDNLTNINNYAFQNCTSLKSIEIPSKVTTIGNYAFHGCRDLIKINFNATNVTDRVNNNYIFQYAGENGEGIIFDVGSNVTRIPAYLFYPTSSTTVGYPKIVEVKFEQGSVCESIGANAFNSCERLISVDLPDSVKNIETYAFVCKRLEQIKLPEGLISIDDCAFINCTSLKKIELPESLITLGSSAFKNCKGLTEVIIPENVESIGANLYRDCTGLKTVTINGNIMLAEKAFSGCTNLTTIYFNATNAIDGAYSSLNAFSDAGTAGKGITVYIGANVTRIPAYLFYVSATDVAHKIIAVHFEKDSVCNIIASYAFGGSLHLKSIIIPESVATISLNAFAATSGLTIYTKLPNSESRPENWVPSWNSSRPVVYDAKTLYFDANGGKGYSVIGFSDEISSTLPIGDEIGITRAGYYFIGWSTNPNGELGDGDSFAVGETYIYSADTMLYAIWGGIDKSVLEELVGEVDELAATDYTTGTWATLHFKLAEAEALIANEDATQSEINAMVIALQATIDGLIDKTDFNDMKAVVQGIIDSKEDDYTPNSWVLADLENALQAADALVGDDATAQDIEDAIVILETALNKLVLIAQTTTLADYIAIVDELDKQNYISSTWTEFDAKLSAAQGVLSNPNATQTQVDDALAELSAARDGLVLKGDKTSFNELLNDITAIENFADRYTTESWEALFTVIFDNELDDDDYSQDEIDAAFDAILAARNGLEKIEVVQDIEDTVNNIDMLDGSEFTEESWGELQNILEEVERILNDPNSTPDEIEKSLSDLQSAIGGLKSINGDDNGGKSDDKGNTQLILMVLASIALVGGAVFFTMGRRGKRA